ncbi:EB module, partial [Ostertagia ostertagi]
CAPNEISISNTCYPISGIGGPCINSAQCQSSGAYCRNGFCVSNIQYDNPICTMPNQQVERESGVVKNCMYLPCSVGFGCEYSTAMRQYICCGNYDANNDYSYAEHLNWFPERAHT